MKKVFMKISAGTTLAVAIALASCNNAEQVKKQVDEQNAKIQTLVDEKLNGLQEQVNTECAAKVDSAANVVFAAYQEELAAAAKKGGKKPVVKPKPVVKKEEPKKPAVGDGKIGKESDKPTKLGEGKLGTEENKPKKMGEGKIGIQPK